MIDHLKSFLALIDQYPVYSRVFNIVIALVVGMPLSFWLSRLSARICIKKKFSPQITMIVRKVVFYLGVIFVFTSILNQLGFSMTALVGTAGILGVAIGFASQTSVSNVISGLFMISERPFVVGDVIRLGERVGVVQSIDLLSIKIRTFDGLFVRIPNETLIKSELVNITYYQIRRLDFRVRVAFKEDVRHVMDLLREIAHESPLVLDEPAPIVIFTDFGTSSMDILLGCWFYKTDFIATKNHIMLAIKERFEKEAIEIPFPHLRVVTGSDLEQMPSTFGADPEQKPS